MSETQMVVPQNGHALTFSPEQRQMIRDMFANGATDPEFQVFMEVARARGLNPITRQIHLVKRWNGDLNRNVWTPQTGIDGLRSIAERTGKYDGQDEPEFAYDQVDGKLKSAKVKVYRKDWARPAVGIAHFSEYVATTKSGAPTHMWANKPHIMLAKCAEALALRKAFPEDTGGLYTDDEMPAPEEKPERPGKAQPHAETKTPALEGAAAQAVIETPAQAANTEVDPDGIASVMIKRITEGFENEHHHKNWWTTNVNAINALPRDLQKLVRAAYINAGPKEEKAK